MSYYHLARPGADLPLELPEGAVHHQGARHRRELRLLGHGLAHRASPSSTRVDADDITAMAGLPAAREAIRDGAPVAYWRAGITHTANPSGGLEPQPGDFSVRLDPRGQLVAFATGYATDARHRARRSREGDVDRPRGDQEGVRHRRVGLRARSRRALLPCRQDRADLAQSGDAIRARRTAARQSARRAPDPDRAIARSAPRGYKAPPTPMAMRIFKGVGPVVIGGVFVIGWGFGLYYLFKTKNWDALTRRLPLAMCALVVVQVGLSTIGSSGAFQSLLAVVAIAILLIGTVLPALSGVMLWIGRRSPARMWAAEQLTRGRVFAHGGVGVACVEGVGGGAAMAAIGVLADWAALGVAGFEPSISRELNVVDAGIGSMIGDTLSGSAFLVLGRRVRGRSVRSVRVNPIVSTIDRRRSRAGLVAGTDQEAILPALTLVAGMSARGGDRRACCIGGAASWRRGWRALARAC